MSEKKEQILALGEDLIRSKGYNAFSYQEISKPLDIKNAAIHYYFPKKSDLAIEILKNTRSQFNNLMTEHAEMSAMSMLKRFLKIYSDSSKNDRICLIGSMLTDVKTFDDTLQEELKLTVDDIIEKLSLILKKGVKNEEFFFKETPRTKSLLIVTNMLASLQLSRVTGVKDYHTIEKAVIESVKA